MDGNGRWARRRGLPVAAGHRAGTRALRRTVEAALDLGVETLTVYAFSTENWNRLAEEVGYLMKLFHLALNEVTDEMVEKGVKLKFIGERSRVPGNIERALAHAEEATRDCTEITLVIAFSYGGRSEIVDAIRRIPEGAHADMSEEKFAKLLWTKDVPDPDLIIRTGGEMRLSNFLTWQSVYSELFFTKTLWPDFTKEEFTNIIGEFYSRERRIGR
jgi:undecaprenyl diphosphate synthase